MPNWCENILVVYADNEHKINLFYEENKTQKEELDFNCVCLLPEKLKNITSPNNNLSDNDKNSLINKYGYDNWYQWNIANWGTKWGSCETNVYKKNEYEKYELTYYFNTAWTPPDKWFYKLIEKYSTNYDIKLEYSEPGCDFAGYIHYSENELLEDNYSFSEQLWNNCDKDEIKNIIIKIINEENVNITIDDITELAMDEIQIDHVDCIIENIEEMVKEELDNRNNDNIKLKYNCKGFNINKLNL